MSKNLVIVESPAKAKTLTKYLGKEFEVIASYGHIRDLIPKSGAVKPDQDFLMHYQLIEKNAKYASAIAKALKNKTALYLATDPDREGEAIAWHICEFLKEKKALKKQQLVHRITFNEITQKAITNAIQHPKELGLNLIHAQQARRALDYLVGFNLSPLLWKKVRRGLSAGRVQSPALRLVVERELEIESFKAKEYWSIHAKLTTLQAESFEANLVFYQGKKLTQFSITTETQVKDIKKVLIKASKQPLTVSKVEKKLRKRQPAPPFITSTLQQEASHKLGFTAQRTMRIAQQLYEGIDIGSGPIGLITYMRTDSTALSQDAVSAMRTLIQEKYGSKSLPAQARVFKTKSKNAQEAHEAIRPTHVDYLPQQMKAHLNAEQFRLYDLIWKRTLAAQMIHATLELMAIELTDSANNVYRATGNVIVDPGFMSVYQETDTTIISKTNTGAGKNVLLPVLQEEETVNLVELTPLQHFTEPPPRYNEASLIKTLEEYDIGRPSTYVPIISTLKQREYVTLDQKRFYPTDVGRIVYQFLTDYFEQYVDYNFTATLEDDLDSIARGEKNWLPTLKSFWEPFKEKVDYIDSTVQRKEVTQEVLEEQCPKCAQTLTKRLGKRGTFIGCSAYPDCDYTRSVESDREESTEVEVVKDRQCPKCQEALQIKTGRYGKFIGCSQYPKCKHIEPVEKPRDTGVMCPECRAHPLLQRKSRYQKIFYSCKDYPTCRYAVWNEPVSKACPTCSWPILTIKTTKRKGTEEVCPRQICHYAKGISSE